MIDSAGLYKRASEPLLASPLLQPETDPPEGDKDELEKPEEVGLRTEGSLDLVSSKEVSPASIDEYAQLQLRLILATLMVSAFAAAITTLFFELAITISLLFGAILGVLYLWLLARSIGKLGKVSRSVSKIQLLVPVVLFLAVTRVPQLEFLPAIIGFLLYKPTMIAQALFEA